MTRNDFQLIASTLNHNQPRRSEPRARVRWLRLVNDLGVALARTNPRFDPSRFYAAAGLASDEQGARIEPRFGACCRFHGTGGDLRRSCVDVNAVAGRFPGSGH